jgi:hypothetical protein
LRHTNNAIARFYLPRFTGTCGNFLFSGFAAK